MFFLPRLLLCLPLLQSFYFIKQFHAEFTMYMGKMAGPVSQLGSRFTAVNRVYDGFCGGLD